LKLYGELASWWVLLSPLDEYVEEAEFYSLQLGPSASRRLTLLELGSGGGNNAFHMKKSFDVTLVDLSPAMVEISRQLNPECGHLVGDMRSVRLGRQFDRVFIHDAIVYMTTLDDLRLAIETAYVHCRSGGMALFAPDHVRETFRPSTDHGGEDGEGRSLRYLEWTWDPDPFDSTYVVDYAYILRDETGATTVEHDRHEEGLFSRTEWLAVLTETGFQAESVPFDHSELEPGTYEVFVARKP
jgi:SAM-dependent methyltransferase